MHGQVLGCRYLVSTHTLIMKQIAQNLRTGKTVLEEVPTPVSQKGCVLIRTHKTLVSSGTERMLVEFSRANLIEKARYQPEKTRLVLHRIRTDGLLSTIRSISNKLDQLLPLGYCNVGEVIEVGEGANGFKKGDRVVSNGPHAEYVCVPVNLCAKVPANVPDEEAVFGILGAVAMQGTRLLKPALGETIAVIGLGLIGQLTVKLLQLSGCKVIVIEPDPSRLKIAAEGGSVTLNPDEEDVEKRIANLTGNMGVDGVIIAASSKSNEIICQAGRITRKRGTIVLIGDVGLNLNRAEFYHKELTFQVSCSYGPGRYDRSYEQNGIDYPLPYVRWTENRNFHAVLEMLSSGVLQVKPLISKIIKLGEYEKAHAKERRADGIGIIIDYDVSEQNRVISRPPGSLFPPTDIVAGVIGAGNFARMTLLPVLKNASIKYLSSAGGLSAAELSQKYKIPIATADYHEILDDREVDLVLIATRHDLHAQMAIEALNANKHVFVEKPLALCKNEIDQIVSTWQQSEATLTVGFNRRFSPYSVKMKSLLGNALMNVVITVNAGQPPESSWVDDLTVGGGRIVGEACHFVDLVTFLVGSPVVSVCMHAMSGRKLMGTGNASMLLQYENGSTGAVHYFSNGHPFYSKERVEVHSEGRTLILDDFRSLTGYGFKGFSRLHLGREKGHREQFQRLFEQVKSGRSTIPFPEIINTSRTTFAALESLRNNSWVQIP
jgi:predicted dehydrogenase